MAVKSTTELAAISATQTFGTVPKLQRQWVVEVDDPATPHDTISKAPKDGENVISFLDPHPNAAYSLAMDCKVDNYNGSKWHYLVTWNYDTPKQANTDVNPLARPDIWKFSTSGMSIPALWYYDGTTRKALVNSAGDFFEGATTDLSVLTAHISGNRSTFDYARATGATNILNNAQYLGGAAYCWKCDGISGEPAVEIVNDAEVRFYKVEVQLTYRPDGWPLLLPNVGWNYLVGGRKERVYVIDPEDPDHKTKIVSANPQPLNSDGSLQTSYGESNPPIIITRRVHASGDFGQLFGFPP
jgi:hypothetical protein